MTTEQNTNEMNISRRKEDKILYIAIGLPIVIALIVAGGPAIINGIKAIMGVIAPNIWVILIYAYIALIAYLIGRRSCR